MIRKQHHVSNDNHCALINFTQQLQGAEKTVVKSPAKTVDKVIAFGE